ncbi:hypothetical protein B0J17DRAFT_773104 [Rhizoctonia solani]|nr:hypothetical protein B0J17DRAFT_773104 [Rhizoctonia solani]
MSFTRSATGCFACKTKHKKCDEVKPHCLRCQKSRIECPGYTYVHHPNKPGRRLRTLPAPRVRAGQPCGNIHQETPPTNTEEPDLQLQDRVPIDCDPVVSEASHGAPGRSVVASVGTLSEATDFSNARTSSSSFSGSLQPSLSNFNASHRLAVNIATPDATSTPANTIASTPTPLTPGQSSLLAALFSLSQPVPPPQRAELITVPNEALVSNHNIETQGDSTTHENEEPEGAVSVICRQPVPDKTVESNALPFVLQSYVTWIGRMAFDPLKLRPVVRDLVFGHFEAGEQSRCIIALLANIGSVIGSAELVEEKHIRMISMLQNAVRWLLGTVKSRANSKGAELIKALDSALDTIVIHFYASPPSEVIILIQEAAPIFRQLCPEPLNVPINLTSLLQHPLGCLRRFAQIDIIFSVFSDKPMFFWYEVANPDRQPSDLYQSVRAIQDDGIVQWLHGIPDQIILLFAKMKAIRQNGLTPNEQTITSLEQEIGEVQTSSGSSSEPFLAIMRSVVQECWRQTAFVYLYMAVCEDPCDTPRVKKAFKRYMKLLNGTTPGRLPDEFLVLTLQLISSAAQRQRDREVIRRRVLGMYKNDPTYVVKDQSIRLMEDYWARADAEGRQIMWRDVAVSGRQMLCV